MCIICDLIASSLLFVHRCYGPLVKINQHTLPDGLEQVSGSHGTLSCGVQDFSQGVCVLDTSTGIEQSVLTDGDFPDPGDMSGSNWAQGFFTVNRENSTTIEVGFTLESSVAIGEVQLSLLNCPARGIGAPNITLYGMQPNTFPEFDIDNATQVGSITVPESTSCALKHIMSCPDTEYS